MKTMTGARRFALRAVERMREAGCACGGLDPDDAGHCPACDEARRLRAAVAQSFPLGGKAKAYR